MLFLAVNSEIQELKDLLLAEQEEKNKLQVKLQNAENECECPVKNASGCYTCGKSVKIINICGHTVTCK